MYTVDFVVMADHATAPPPPPEFQKPDDYLAMMPVLFDMDNPEDSFHS